MISDYTVNRPFSTLLFSAALASGLFGVAQNATAYDLHDRTLVPIKENAVPAGNPIELIRDGEWRCAIAWNPRCEGAKELSRTEASITPALIVLTNAFAHTFGSVPPIIEAEDEAELRRYPAVIALGASALTRRLGFAPEKEPEQGFTIATCGNALVLHGHDGTQIPAYNTQPLVKYGASRGTYYAAVDFTERFLGARYYFPGRLGTLWRQAKSLAVAPVSYTDRPYYNNRGHILPFIHSCRGEKNVAKWKRLIGEEAAKPESFRFTDLWRAGGTLPSGGGHGPEPIRFAERHPDQLEEIFYKTPYGRLCQDSKNHVGNHYDVTNLGLVDIFAKDIDEMFAGNLKGCSANGWQTLNGYRVSWGQCDTYMNLIDVAFNPIVRELGLVRPADVERALAGRFDTQRRGLFRQLERPFRRRLRRARRQGSRRETLSARLLQREIPSERSALQTAGESADLLLRSPSVRTHLQPRRSRGCGAHREGMV